MKKISISWSKSTTRSKRSIRRSAFQLLTSTSLLSFLWLAGCATAPTKFHEKHQGQWSGQVQVQQKGKSTPLAVTFRAVSPKRFRADISTVTGIFVGSLLVTEGKFKALVVRERKFYQGTIRKETLKKVMSIPIDLSWMGHVLLEVPEESWQCSYDSNKYIESCTEEKTGFKVTWIERNLDQRRIEIEVAEAKANLVLNEFQDHLEEGSKAFNLKAPRRFKVVRLK